MDLSLNFESFDTSTTISMALSNVNSETCFRLAADFLLLLFVSIFLYLSRGLTFNFDAK